MACVRGLATCGGAGTRAGPPPNPHDFVVIKIRSLSVFGDLIVCVCRTARRDPLVPVVVGIGGLLVFDCLEPWILARRLVKVTMDAKFHIVHLRYHLCPGNHRVSFLVCGWRLVQVIQIPGKPRWDEAEKAR